MKSVLYFPLDFSENKRIVRAWILMSTCFNKHSYPLLLFFPDTNTSAINKNVSYKNVKICQYVFYSLFAHDRYTDKIEM